jgi:hypothetical protein
MGCAKYPGKEASCNCRRYDIIYAVSPQGRSNIILMRCIYGYLAGRVCWLSNDECRHCGMVESAAYGVNNYAVVAGVAFG